MMNTRIEDRGLSANRENNMQSRVADVQMKQETQNHETNFEENVAVLEKKILEYHRQLCQLRLRRSQATAMPNDLNVQREKMALAKVEDGVLKHMLEFVGNNSARGFVYGIIPLKGSPVSGSSDNLRAWWKQHVKFYLNGPVAIAKYHRENSSIAGEDPYGMNSITTTAQALTNISDATLCSILSALMAHCNPPQKDYPWSNGCPPPWWPKGNEEWSHEVLRCEVPPYRRPQSLKKAWKVVVLAAVMKHLFPDIDKIRRIINERKGLYDKMSAREASVWCRILDREQVFANVMHTANLFAAMARGESSRTTETDGYNLNLGQEVAAIPSSLYEVCNCQSAQEATTAARLAAPIPLPTTQLTSNCNFLKRKREDVDKPMAIDLNVSYCENPRCIFKLLHH